MHLESGKDLRFVKESVGVLQVGYVDPWDPSVLVALSESPCVLLRSFLNVLVDFFVLTHLEHFSSLSNPPLFLPLLETTEAYDQNGDEDNYENHDDHSDVGGRGGGRGGH